MVWQDYNLKESSNIKSNCIFTLKVPLNMKFLGPCTRTRVRPQDSYGMARLQSERVFKYKVKLHFHPESSVEHEISWTLYWNESPAPDSYGMARLQSERVFKYKVKLHFHPESSVEHEISWT